MLNNSIDITILAILAIALVWGGYKGAIRQIASLCGVVFGIIAARLYCDTVGGWMNHVCTIPNYLLPAIPFLFIFLTVLIVCSLAGKLMDGFFSAAGVGWFNRCLGAGFAVGKWVLILSVLLNIGELLGVHQIDDFATKRSTSRLYVPVRSFAPVLFPYLPVVIEKAKAEME